MREEENQYLHKKRITGVRNRLHGEWGNEMREYSTNYRTACPDAVHGVGECNLL